MAVIKALYQCVDICAQRGIREVIICPGSRNAALTVAFEQHPAIHCYSISDERSAAFVAMGMTQESGRPVAILCTSGTAVLNFYPAIAEAYFQQIPLLVLTADRPPEWIHQYDGQTIFQENVYGKHVKKSYQLLPDYAAKDVAWFAGRSFNEALTLLTQAPAGPVHINIPVREPFYPSPEESTTGITGDAVSVIYPEKKLSTEQLTTLRSEISAANSVVILVGQNADAQLNTALESFRTDDRFLIIGDCMANVRSDVHTQDILFKYLNSDDLPDMLITCGMSLIAKNMKLFFRQHSLKSHWHVQETTELIDPLQSITKQIPMNAAEFFRQLIAQPLAAKRKTENQFRRNTISLDKTIKAELTQKLNELPFSDAVVLGKLLPQLNENSILHLGNSMSIRYVNVLSHWLPAETKIYVNRGTSGIEGSLSTAVGHALATEKTVYCILGDVSFQYDKNALWNDMLPNNLKIIVLNNQGGNIFRMIPGPSEQVGYKAFFETNQKNTAQWICKEFGVAYYSIAQEMQQTTLTQFLTEPETALLEIFTDPATNETVFKTLMRR